MATVDTFLSRGAYINAVDDLRFTPLHDACLYQRQAIVKALLEAGARVDLVDFH